MSTFSLSKIDWILPKKISLKNVKWGAQLLLRTLFIFEVQVNLCQKLLFLHQLTHNIMRDCSWNYKFNTWKFQAQTGREHVVYRNYFWQSGQFLYTTCSPPCSAKRRASDKDLPVSMEKFLVRPLQCCAESASTGWNRVKVSENKSATRSYR